MSQIRVSVEIPRSPEVVRAWWTEFPEIYENAREQPHRIVTRARTHEYIDTLTYWRGPMGKELEVPELFTLRSDGCWDVDITLPFGLSQRDVFTLTPTATGTRVDIEVEIWCRTAFGRLALPFFRSYAAKNYPRTWRAAARWCEEATPAR